VLMRAPIDTSLASVLDAVPGLTGVSMSVTGQFDLWRLTDLPSRVSVQEPDGTVVPVTSGPVGVAGARVPAAGGTLLLAEPAGNWSASVNGHALASVASPAGRWAQAFKLPPGGGTLTIIRSALLHDLVTALELLAFVVVAALALPGIRTAAEIEAATAAVTTAGGPDEDDSEGPGESREPEDAGVEREAVLVGAAGSASQAAGPAGQEGQPGRAGRAGRGGAASGDRREGAGRGKKLGRSGARRGARARLTGRAGDAAPNVGRGRAAATAAGAAAAGAAGVAGGAAVAGGAGVAGGAAATAAGGAATEIFAA